MLIYLLYFVIALAVLYVALYFYSSRNYNYWKKKGIPFHKPSAFFGNMTDFFKLKRSFFGILQEYHLQDKLPYVGFFLMDKPLLLIKDPDVIKSVLVKDFNHFYDRNIANNVRDDPIGGNMLFMSKNPFWKDVRKKLTPVFTSGKVKLMYQLTANAGEAMVEYLKRQCPDEAIIETKEICSKYTTENITSTAYGIQANCFTDENAEFRQISRRLFDFNDLTIAIPQTCWFIAHVLVKIFHFRFIDSYSAKFLTKAFWGAMNDREKNKIQRNDLLDILIQMRHEENPDFRLEDEQILAQATQFFIAGFETTSSTIHFALWELARQKDIQDRLRAEIREQAANHGGKINYDALKDMTYLDQVVKETLRIYPVIPFLERRCNKDYQIPGTKDVIEKGTAVFISSIGLHMDPQYFPNPEVFDPERFTEENFSKVNPMAYLPFGEGPRNCIGMRFGMVSTKSGIAYIVNNFELELCDESHKTITFNPKGHTLATDDGKLFIKFKRIKA